MLLFFCWFKPLFYQGTKFCCHEIVRSNLGATSGVSIVPKGASRVAWLILIDSIFWGPVNTLCDCWFITPSNYSYNSHKPYSYGHLLVIAGYFYGIIHSVNGVSSVLITGKGP